MELKWAHKALEDLVRLHKFLAPVNPQAAARIVQALAMAPTRLVEQPRLGEKVPEFEPREVRRLLVGNYELRYEVQRDRIVVLRLWHTREQRL